MGEKECMVNKVFLLLRRGPTCRCHRAFSTLFLWLLSVVNSPVCLGRSKVIVIYLKKRLTYLESVPSDRIALIRADLSDI